MIQPGTYNITMYRGRDFDVTFTISDANGTAIDLTGYTIKSEVRSKKNRDSRLMETFTVTETDLANGEFKISLTDTETDAISGNSGYYDVLITDTSDITYSYITGTVTIDNTVTEKA